MNSIRTPPAYRTAPCLRPKIAPKIAAAMSVSVRLSLPPYSTFRRTQTPPHLLSNRKSILPHLHTHPIQPLQLQASRRIPNFQKGGRDLVDDPRYWAGSLAEEYDDEADDEEEDRSLELFIKFAQNLFRKIAKRVRKAVRSVLPISIPTDLLRFSVNGGLMLSFLWFFKAFLEVVCTLGSVVFVSILLIRLTWTGLTYLQESRNEKTYSLDGDNSAWTGVRPAT